MRQILTCRWLLRARRRVFAHLPFMPLVSDVQDVVYLNWVVPLDRVQSLVPPGLCPWQRDGMTVLTVLTYRHGHFGPPVPKWLRRVFPSPLQSNWRLYLEDSARYSEAVFFIDNVMDSLPYTAGARLLSDALPTHLADKFRHTTTGDVYETLIVAGEGSAPDFRCRAERVDARELPDTLQAWFTSWEDAVARLTLRQCAIARVPDIQRLAIAGIDLPVDVAQVLPLTLQPGSFHSDALHAIIGDALPFCFAVPEVKFGVLWERLL
ncbi:uncharacterized protein YqjF (DUF2071 family) [Lysobacter niastensis]|uniref:Uncharacterized protein YqjF (DUF2071 family) n=1 Tax=Lysobacter niastensis TaxID=380629 RepID=A0ABU1WE11_9GAMM|nr:DUF2071 domain-containing protein [Lysobacter niastensis]MDR7135645.1 uncharacterized protein YqjF (DUF2071 family) [Lysobacter niastensis]